MSESKAGPFPSSEDRQAAQQLLAAAKYTKDAEDLEAFAQVWASDATLTIHSNNRQVAEIVGRDDILNFYRENWARGAHGTAEGRETHVAEPAHIVALPDGRLLSIHNTIFAAMNGDLPVLVGFGEFRDELVKEDGCWRIHKRTSRLRRRQKEAQ